MFVGDTAYDVVIMSLVNAIQISVLEWKDRAV